MAENHALTSTVGCVGGGCKQQRQRHTCLDYKEYLLAKFGVDASVNTPDIRACKRQSTVLTPPLNCWEKHKGSECMVHVYTICKG